MFLVLMATDVTILELGGPTKKCNQIRLKWDEVKAIVVRRV